MLVMKLHFKKSNSSLSFAVAQHVCIYVAEVQLKSSEQVYI